MAFHRCEFCDFVSKSEEGFGLHSRTCIPKWKHDLLSPHNISYSDALMTCFTLIERQNEIIQSMRTEWTKTKPYIRTTKKNNHADILAKLRPVIPYDEWVQNIDLSTYSMSISDLIQNGIKETAQTILSGIISIHSIPSFEIPELEFTEVTLPIFLFSTDPATIHIWNGEWVRMDSNMVYSLIVFIYSRISEKYLKMCIELGDISKTMQVMEELNKHQPKNNISEYKQFLSQCLVRQIK